MHTMKIYEPAMCCSTGLCGVGIDPELLRVSTVLRALASQGIEVTRYNLTSAPMEFARCKAVSDFLQAFGPEKLPVTLVDDVPVIAGRYPTTEEFYRWLALVPPSPCGCADASPAAEGCCTDGACCCTEAAPAQESCADASPAQETGACCCQGMPDPQEAPQANCGCSGCC